MLTGAFGGIKIAAVACAVPTTVQSARSVYEEHGQEYTEKIERTIGVRQIRKSIKKQVSSDLGYVAARHILDAKKIDVKSVGVLVYVTQSPDYPLPATSCILHKRLGLSVDCAAVDINNGCSGFVYGAHIACSMLSNLNCRYALLILGDISTSKKDRVKRVSVPFGDGTAAALFEKAGDGSHMEFSLNTRGEGYRSLIKHYGAYRAETYEPDELNIGRRKTAVTLMNGVDVFNFSITDVPEQINQFVASLGKTISDYDCVALHQPNLYMIRQIAKKIGADMERVPVSLTNYGNTNSASIPLTLVDRYGDTDGGNLRVLMCGFGVGLLWGTMSAEIAACDILPMQYSDDYFTDPELDKKEYD